MIANSVGSTHASATALLHARMHEAPPGHARRTPIAVVPEQAALAGEITTTQQSLLDALAPLVGMTSDELQSTLAAGQPLESLAAQYGVDLKALSEKLETTTGILLDVKA
jgi:hypothetical protein